MSREADMATRAHELADLANLNHWIADMRADGHAAGLSDFALRAFCRLLAYQAEDLAVAAQKLEDATRPQHVHVVAAE